MSLVRTFILTLVLSVFCAIMLYLTLTYATDVLIRILMSIVFGGLMIGFLIVAVSNYSKIVKSRRSRKR